MVKLSPIKRVATKCKSNKLKQLKATRRSARLKNNKFSLYSQFNNNYSLSTVEYPLTLKQETEPQQQGCSISIHQLPTEILLHIFKYLSSSDLWYTVKFVCRQWDELTKCQCLWETIEANRDIPTHILQEWLKIAPTLKTLKLSNRKDADIIIEQASKCNRQLVSIEARDCWGSNFRRNVKSKPLCNLLRRCPMLSNINFEGTRFISCKFYKLMAKHSTLHSPMIKRRKTFKTQNCKVNSINYSGCANGRQIKAFLLARNAKTDHLAHILFEGWCKRHSWRLSDDYEIVQHVINLNNDENAPLLNGDDEDVIGDANDGGALPQMGGDGNGDGIVIQPIENERVHVLEPLQDGNAMDRLEVRMDDIDAILEYIGLF